MNLNLTYLGSTPPGCNRTKCKVFFGWNSKNLRIIGLLLAAMGTHVSFILRGYFTHIVHFQWVFQKNNKKKQPGNSAIVPALFGDGE